MGTLTGISFSAVNFKFRSDSVFREKTGVGVLSTKKLMKKSCLLCKKKHPKEIFGKKFYDGIRCLSANNDDGEIKDDKISKDSSDKTVPPPEEAEESFIKILASLVPKLPKFSLEEDFEEDFGEDYDVSAINVLLVNLIMSEFLGSEKVDPSDVKIIKDNLFGHSTFWITKEESIGFSGEGILFLGNLRGKREGIFAKLQTKLAELMGDKYNLFMIEDPILELPFMLMEDLPGDPRGGPRVSFALLRKEGSESAPTTLWQYVLALILFLLTIGSSIKIGIESQINQLPPEVVKYFTDPNAIKPPDMELLFPFVESALPLASGVLGVLLFHEVGHFLAASSKNIKLSIPFFIPDITRGSFGAITLFKYILPDRSTLVDISLAGPFAGAALSFSMFVVGLFLSSNPDAGGDWVQVPGVMFQGSLLLGLISRASLGYTALHAATVSVHPLVIAGWCGLTTTAFNLLPVGSLDGGRAMQGAFGIDAATGTNMATYILLGLGMLGGPLALPWGLFVFIFQSSLESPCLNDVTEVGTLRKTIVTLAVLLAVLTLVPVGDKVAEELGIGLVTTLDS